MAEITPFLPHQLKDYLSFQRMFATNSAIYSKFHLKGYLYPTEGFTRPGCPRQHKGDMVIPH